MHARTHTHTMGMTVCVQCAQACRLPYGLIVDGMLKDLQDLSYLLSPQDLMAVSHVPGVCAHFSGVYHACHTLPIYMYSPSRTFTLHCILFLLHTELLPLLCDQLIMTIVHTVAF